MEVDLDLSQDRLRDFLQSKLQELTLQNRHLKVTRLEYKEKLAQKTTLDPLITIELLWKTVYNGKFVVCFQLPHLKHFDQLNVALNCHHLNYTVRTFKQAKSTLVTLTFEIAQLIALASFDLHGFATVQVGENNVKTVQLPQVTVKPATMPQPVNKNLASMSSSLENNLVLILPEEWTIPISSTLEINCGLTYTQSNAQGCHYLYNDSIAVNTSTSNTEVLLTVYTKCEEELLMFVHHLLSSLPDSLVLPQVFYDKFKLDQPRNKCLEEFAQTLSLELSSGLLYCQKVLHHGGDLSKLGELSLKLCQLECDSDLAYFKVQKLL